MGRGRGSPHGRSNHHARTAVVGIDHFFITRGGLKRRSEMDQASDEAGDAEIETVRKAGELIRCFVVRCSKFKCVFAHVVPCRGVDEDEDNDVVDLIEKCLNRDHKGYATFNVSTGTSTSVQDILESVKSGINLENEINAVYRNPDRLWDSYMDLFDGKYSI